MKAAIYGAGSLGTILGAYITKNGGQVDLINRNRPHIEALKQNGATVTGYVNFNQKVNALYIEEMKDKYDCIFLMTKQQDNENTVKFLKDYLADDGVIVTMQNGLPEMLIGSIVGEDRVLGCTVAWGATMLGPGVCELTSEPDTLTVSLGSLTAPSHPRIPEVKAMLELMGPVTVDDNFVGTRWSKLLINAAFSGMSTVLGCTFGQACSGLPQRKVVQKLMKECMDVCDKGGIKIEPVQGKDITKLFNFHGPVKKAFSLFLIPFAMKKHKSLKASMLQDIEKGKLTEVDSINGSVCAYGRKIGFPTPANDKVVELIHKIEKGELKPSMDNLKFFK